MFVVLETTFDISRQNKSFSHFYLVLLLSNRENGLFENKPLETLFVRVQGGIFCFGQMSI